LTTAALSIKVMDSLQTIRVLLLGDSGVGKTSIVNYLCKKNEPTAITGWTVSCHLDAIIIEYGESNNRNKKYLVEFIDVGGGSHGYAASRSVFYTFDISAILLVHDLSNIRSFSNLFKWIDEFSTVNGVDSSTLCNKIPMLLVGNKLDKLNTSHHANNNKRKQQYKKSMKNNIYNMVELSTLVNNNDINNRNRNGVNSNNIIRKFNDFFSHVFNNYNKNNGYRV
jgi:small GTP-binding protein